MTSSRLGIVRRSPAFGLLFLATAGSAVGTYIAAIALTLHVKDLTGESAPLWVAALLIADFLPIVLIGLLLGPLVDRLSRRGLMVASDLVRVGVFVALPFTDSPAAIVAVTIGTEPIRSRLRLPGSRSSLIRPPTGGVTRR